MSRHITSIQLQNFQSHSNTTVNVAPSGQLTILTGPSDSGKTAILRGLRWLLYNEPQGADFIRVGCEFARVTVGFSDGSQVIRERRKSGRNQYITIQDKNRQVYEGFGTNVPLEVQLITGVRPVTIGDMELNLNLSEQLDGPFLGKQVSAGARAKVLGKLAGTEEIDIAGKTLGTDLYRREQDKKRLEKEIKDKDAEMISQYDYLPGLAARIERLEQVVARAKELIEKREALELLDDKLNFIDAKILHATNDIKRWQGISSAEKIVAQTEKQITLQGTLGSLQNDYERAEYHIDQNNELLFRWRSLPGIVNAATRAQEATERRGVLYPLGERLGATDDKAGEAIEVLTQWHILPELEQLFAKITEAENRRGPLNTLWTRLFFTDGLVRDQEFLLKKYAGVAEAAVAGRNVAEAVLRRGTLIDLRQNLSINWATIQMTNEQLWHNQKKLAAVRSVEIAEDAMVQRKALYPLLIQLRGADKLIHETQCTKSWFENEVCENEVAYQDELMAAGKCPTCGADTDQMNIREVV